MRQLPRKHDAVATAEAIRSARQLLPMTVDQSPEQIGAVIAEALGDREPRLDLAQLIAEYKRLRDGIIALSEDLSKSVDMEELRLFEATVDEFRNGLYQAPVAARTRLYDLERWERNNTLWMAGEYL